MHTFFCFLFFVVVFKLSAFGFDNNNWALGLIGAIVANTSQEHPINKQEHTFLRNGNIKNSQTRCS